MVCFLKMWTRFINTSTVESVENMLQSEIYRHYVQIWLLIGLLSSD